MNLIPSLRLGAFCCALAFPAVFLFQFLFPAAFLLKTPELIATTCAPTLECREDYTALLFPVDPGAFDNNATATIHAGDLVVSAASNCSDAFHYTIYFLYQIESGEAIPQAIDPDSIVVNCNYCGRHNFRLYAWDDQYNPDSVQPDGTIGGPNYSYCEVIVLIDDAFSVCNCDYQSISGVIETIEGEPLKGVNIFLNGTYDLHDITNSQGDYYFSYVSHGQITPQLDTLPLNGISTLDVVLISRHILGIQSLNGPYNRIAADVNHDNKITIADVLWLKRLILGIDSIFTNNTSWRFVPASYVFPVPTIPWFEPFPEVLNVTQFSDFMLYANFIAIKIGDVNSSAATSLLIPETETPDPRGALPERTIQPYLQPAPEYGAAVGMATDTCAPVIECISGMAVELFPVENPPLDVDGDGDLDYAFAAVWALDFVDTSGSACSDSLRFSIHKLSAVLSGEEIPQPGPDQEYLLLTCDDLGSIPLRIYVWDDNFNPDAVQPDGSVGGPNYSYCETFVLVQDNLFDACTIIDAGITGLVETAESKPVANVKVILSGSASDTTYTGTHGGYYFDWLDWGPSASYTITPHLDSFHVNGLSAFDIILIRRHVLGIQPLPGPYKLIAADVNGDQKITSLDLIQIQQLILALATDFSNNTSWRFIPSDYVFPDPTNPWFEVFPESSTLNGSPFGASTNFIAIKIGDLNGSAVTN